MKVGVVGAGRILSAYLEAARHSAFEIAALCDLGDPALPSDADKLPLFSDFRDMAKLTQLDAFIIAVPSSKHFDVATMALETRRPLLIEKPVTLSAEQFNRLRDISSANETPVFSLLHAQYGSEVIAVRKHLSEFRQSSQAPVSVDWYTELCDPYKKNRAAQSSLINSWVDGGINALSIIKGALKGTQLTRVSGIHTPGGENWAQTKSRQTFELSGDWRGTVTIDTDWSKNHAMKTSSAKINHGTRMELHHTNETIEITGTARQTFECFQNARSRLANHYVAAFQDASKHIEKGHSNWDFSLACHAPYFSCFPNLKSV